MRRAHGLRPVFDGLLAVAAGPLNNETGERIRNYVMGWLERHPLESFDRYSDRNYVRSYLGRCPAPTGRRSS